MLPSSDIIDKQSTCSPPVVTSCHCSKSKEKNKYNFDVDLISKKIYFVKQKKIKFWLFETTYSNVIISLKDTLYYSNSFSLSCLSQSLAISMSVSVYNYLSVCLISYLSCPAVSQIWSLIFCPETWNIIKILNKLTKSFATKVKSVLKTPM